MYIAASATSADNRILNGLDNCIEDPRRSATRNNGLTREHHRRYPIVIVAHPASEQPPTKVLLDSHRVAVPDRLGNRKLTYRQNLATGAIGYLQTVARVQLAGHAWARTSAK